MLNQLYKIALPLIIVLNAGGHTAWANSRQIAVDDSIAIASQFVEQLPL